MSYILDALKKSEQDRGNGSVPNVQTIHSSALNYQQENRSLWPWILIAVLIANVFILIYFLKPETEIQPVISENNNQTTTVIVHQDKTVIEKKYDETPTPIAAPIITTSQKQAAQKLNNEYDSTNISVTQDLKSIIEIDELPINIRQQIPNMVFSAHVYSSTPLMRSLVINDRFLEEGSAINQDLTLVEITRNGAIFDFQGYRFRTGVLSGWSTH